MEIVEISDGLKLFRRDKYFKNDEKVIASTDLNSLVMRFNLNAKDHRGNFLNDKFPFEKLTNIDLIRKFEADYTIPKNTHRQMVAFMLDKEFLYKILPEQKQSDKILNFFETKKTSQKIYNDKMRFKTQTLAYDILNNPYKNSLDKLYVEAKSLELIYNELTTLLAEQDNDPFIKFSNKDKEAIYNAREILITHLTNPPSMKELAKMVAINDLKLKIGFRKFFNQTPYSISLEHRLQEAKKLLHKSDMNINEIAEHIGYKHAANFSNAFIKRFGIRPKDIMKSRKYYY